MGGPYVAGNGGVTGRRGVSPAHAAEPAALEQEGGRAPRSPRPRPRLAGGFYFKLEGCPPPSRGRAATPAPSPAALPSGLAPRTPANHRPSGAPAPPSWLPIGSGGLPSGGGKEPRCEGDPTGGAGAHVTLVPAGAASPGVAFPRAWSGPALPPPPSPGTKRGLILRSRFDALDPRLPRRVPISPSCTFVGLLSQFSAAKQRHWMEKQIYNIFV